MKTIRLIVTAEVQDHVSSADACNSITVGHSAYKIKIAEDSRRADSLLSLIQLAKESNLPEKWLKAEAEAGRIPYLKVLKLYRFNLNAVISVLMKRAAEFPVGEKVQVEREPPQPIEKLPSLEDLHAMKLRPPGGMTVDEYLDDLRGDG